METGEDAEIARPTFVMDFDNIATGWMLFREGQAPERVIDPSIDQPAPSPGAEFKRGFLVMTYSPKFFGGAAEFAGTFGGLERDQRGVRAVRRRAGQPPRRASSRGLYRL